MTTKSFYPNSYNSSTGGVYQPFKNLSNLHSKKTDSFANTELIHGKHQPLRRPGAVTVSNFKCGLPTGSLVTKITVVYAHSKVEYNNKVCNIPAPTVTIMNGKNSRKWSTGKPMAKVGKAPTTKVQESKIVFGTKDLSLDYSVVNDSSFGVNINYPTNTNNDEGYMRLYYVYIVLEYRTPSFSLSAQSSKANTGFNGDDFELVLDLSNTNNTRYIPSVTISAPLGFSYLDCTGNGTVKKVQNGVFVWTPSKMYGHSTVSITLRFNVNVTIPSGGSYSGRFDATESLLGKSSYYVAVIEEKSDDEGDGEDKSDSSIGNLDKDNYLATVTGTVNEETVLVIDTTGPVGDALALPPDTKIFDGIEYSLEGWSAFLYVTPVDDNTMDNYDLYCGIYGGTEEEVPYEKLTGSKEDLYDYTSSNIKEYKFKGTRPGVYVLKLIVEKNISWLGPGERPLSKYEEYTVDVGEMYINIKPSTLTTPNYTILSLTGEELNRLGDTTYIIQTYLKQNTSEKRPHDWGQNHRIGVFNNAITDNITTIIIPSEDEDDYEEITVDSTNYNSLTSEDIFNNADYWSNTLTSVNTYENLECKFHYNKNYPLFIILTGDYPEASTTSTIRFTEPCIIEEDYYNGHETNGTYPVPIENTKLSTGEFSELDIESLGSATPIIFYNLPLDEDYGTNEEIAIRGLEVTGTIEQNTDDLHIYCKLKAPTGESRTRSINLNVLDTTLNSGNTFSLGGMGDLWGLSTLDIKNLEDWEIELMVDNTINNNTGTINFSNIALTIYISEIDSQNIQCKIENEDLSYYGAFLTDVDIPAGLKTDVDYLTIDGTDTNDPYRQNIKEKEITIHLDIGDNCSLEASTLSLMDLARLLQNKRDKYNRPIPKRIEFSHYPDLYWEYIMEDTFDNNIEISTYEVKIKLTVPSGTAYKKQSTVTNRTGYVNGLANVSPVIVIKPTDNLMTITETLTDQNFHIGYPETLTDKVIVIDCEDRIVWLKTDEDDEDGENITQYVDFNSDWFSIIDEYQFDTTGCIIKTVDYVERWST